MTVAIFTGSRDTSLNPRGRWYERASDVIRADDMRSHDFYAFVGCCPTGLDYSLRGIRRSFSVPNVLMFKADWYPNGPDAPMDRGAGPKRNSRMVKAAAALAEALGVELVCHAWPLGESRGTRDCMRKAKAAGARVVVHTEGE